MARNNIKRSPGSGKGKPTKGKKGPKKPGSRRPAAKAADQPYKRRKSKPAVRTNLEEGERLQKVLAAAGIASRRECELLIEEGRVEVDGELVTELGKRVDPAKHEIRLDGEPLTKRKRVYFAVNKPEGVVCTARDPSGRPRVIDLLPPDAGRVFAVGRLDLASEGLILVTNDGELANQITHPKHGVEKTYHVQVQGFPTVETLAQLRQGVRLAEGTAHFVHARIKSKRKTSTVLEVVLDEGRNREIRRVLARVGHKVQRLTRVAVGPVRLGEMPLGTYRPLTSKELKDLHAAVDATGSGTGQGAVKKKMASAKKSAGASASGKRPTKRKPATKSAAPKKIGGRRIIGELPTESEAKTEKPVRKTAAKKPSGRPTGKPSSKPTSKKFAGKKTTKTKATGKSTSKSTGKAKRTGGKSKGTQKGRPNQGRTRK